MRNKPEYVKLVEYTEYNNHYPEELVTKLINSEICSVRKGKIIFKVTGIFIYRNAFYVIFPKNYNVPMKAKESKEHIQLLYKVLMKYRREAKLELEEVDLLGGNEGEYSGNLITASNLIDDFTVNGLLKREMEIKSSVGSGRTDWLATISKKRPIISEESIVYFDTISKRTSIDRQNILLKLHKYCIYKSVEKYGWLLGFNFTDFNLTLTEMPCDINYAIHILEMEMSNTFIERDLNVIKLMINFLLGIQLAEKEARLEVLLTPYFYNVWEEICSNIYKNEYRKLKKIIPKLNWKLDSGAKRMSQRPDIMLIRDRALYILDAKYYDVDVNLPGWPDVVKQLFYASTILNNIKSGNFEIPNLDLEKQISRLNKVVNIFIFPSSSNEAFKYIGKVNVENNNEFDDVKAYKVSIYLAMQCYVGKKNYDFSDNLFEEFN